MAKITAQQLKTLAPSARSSYRDAFTNGQVYLDQFGISKTSQRLAHFLAQILHESADLMFQFENLNYSAERLTKVWPSRFLPKGKLNPTEYAFNPQKLANEVYGGRMGNIKATDGFVFRGRGLLQLTGRDGYRNATTILRKTIPTAPDFTTNPDAVISAEWSLAIAAAIWDSKGCNAFADKDDIKLVTKAINGGQIGIAERTEMLKRTKAILCK